jgi:Na+-translocating ferredoxin:NAD+ oxidoreductase RnfC subunit
VECDPGLIHDKWVMRQYPDEIYAGIELLSRNIEFKTVTLTVKDDYGLHFPEGLKIYRVRDYYPAGAEKILIKEVLGINVPQDKVTANFGILVLNVQTIYSIYEAAYMNKRADTKYITAADVSKNNGCVVKVKLGDNVHNVLQHLYPSASVNNEFVGGGLMQCHVSYDDEVIDKSTNFIALADMPVYKESPNCSSCGLCSTNCPMGLKVNLIADIADSGRFDMTKKYHPEKCINCGICSYICLAGRNLSSKVRNSKEYLKSGHC